MMTDLDYELALTDGAFHGCVVQYAKDLRAHAEAVERWGAARRRILAAVIADDRADFRGAILDYYQADLTRMQTHAACVAAEQKVDKLHIELLALCAKAPR